MIYEPSFSAVFVFGVIVAITLGLSFYLGSKARSSKGYFAAGGGIHWFGNGVAFAGDYLSAASFLGICGMIAFYGYDGFLYSIGYLAGWIVALFVIAEPLRQMGKYTFADALDSRFHSSGLKLAAAVSTLAVSVFYLIPQMVGAGALVKPLLGFSHEIGVITVGAVVIFIVVTAGMVSTTYVQFLKGSLLVVFSFVLTVMILARGFEAKGPEGEVVEGESTNLLAVDAGDYERSRESLLEQLATEPGLVAGSTLVEAEGNWKDQPFVRLRDAEGVISTWYAPPPAEGQTRFELVPAQTVTTTAEGRRLVNGRPQGKGEGEGDLWPVGSVRKLPGDVEKTGPLNPFSFLSTIQRSEVVVWRDKLIPETGGGSTRVYFPQVASGDKIMRPGNHPSFAGLQSGKWIDRINFFSLMLALFGGTASLPHILIRYYTVKDQAAARKSTIVGIAAIGFFYILTLFIGLGAMTSGSLDVTDSNMAAPLLARSFNEWLFAIISAIAFTTVLGTVSGLIIASAGAVVHDLLGSFFKWEMQDHSKVRIAKIASVVVGVVAIVLGILFKSMNVNFLVGWAFSVAASANLPSLVTLLFWKGTTRYGIIASITIGMVSSLGWILLSGDTFKNVYGLPAENAIVPFSQPGIITIPLGFLVLIVVSLVTREK